MIQSSNLRSHAPHSRDLTPPLSPTQALILQDNLALIGYQDFKIHREDRCVYPPCHGLTYACALFGTGDQLFLPHTDPCATYLNRPWTEFFRRKAVTPADIWSADVSALGETVDKQTVGQECWGLLSQNCRENG